MDGDQDRCNILADQHLTGAGRLDDRHRVVVLITLTGRSFRGGGVIEHLVLHHGRLGVDHGVDEHLRR